MLESYEQENNSWVFITCNLFCLYVCYHILSAYLSFNVILGYDLKIYQFMDNYA